MDTTAGIMVVVSTEGENNKGGIVMKNRYKKTAEEILGIAGVQINGSHPWVINLSVDGIFIRVQFLYLKQNT